jgi:hypothetical protein
MPFLELQDHIWLSEEDHSKLEEIVSFHNEWAAQQEDTKHLAPMSLSDYLLVSMKYVIREEHAKMLREQGRLFQL